MTCSSCGTSSDTPLCPRCEGYQQWASRGGSHEGTDTAADQRLQRKLDRAKSDLAALPDLCASLAACLTERRTVPGGGGGTGKISGSPALVRLDVLDLIDDRRETGWEGEDPRQADVVGRYGVAPTLETWTRVVAEEMPKDERPEMAETATVSSECNFLLTTWEWVSEQPWAEELSDDVHRLTSAVRAGLGIRREYQPRCRYCRSRVHPVESGTHEPSSWEACAYGLCAGCGATFPPGPALDALGQVQPPMLLREIAELTGIPRRTLADWYGKGLIRPETGTQERSRLFDLAKVNQVAARLRAGSEAS